MPDDVHAAQAPGQVSGRASAQRIDRLPKGKGGLFLTEGDLRATGDYRLPHLKLREEYELQSPLIYEVGGPGSGVIVTVPAGYRSDGYSMPGRLLQLWQPHAGRWWLPAILHDWLYDVGLAPRPICDGVLREAMAAVGVPRTRQLIVWSGVRAGGWLGYGRPLPVNAPLVIAARAQGLDERLSVFLQRPGSIG